MHALPHAITLRCCQPTIKTRHLASIRLVSPLARSGPADPTRSEHALGPRVWAVRVNFRRWIESRSGVGSTEAKRVVDGFQTYLSTLGAHVCPTDPISCANP
jgi:hypothetical protein